MPELTPDEVMPGYSPWAISRQSTPFLNTPGVQGLTEGVEGGQGIAKTPTEQLFGLSGSGGTAAPSSMPDPGRMWEVFGGSGGAQSSLATQPSHGAMSVPAVIDALQDPSQQAGQQNPYGTRQQPYGQDKQPYGPYVS